MDRLFRFLNRNKLLVVMYHGVTIGNNDIKILTQLPVDMFRKQILFLREHYNIVPLSTVTQALQGFTDLPKRAALITFDDGLKNNFSVVFPILRDLHVPATIFLTTDFISTREILWFDECYLLMREAALRGICLTLCDEKAQSYFDSKKIGESYRFVVESLKRAGCYKRNSIMENFRKDVPLDKERFLADFGPLDWDDVQVMHRSGIVEFGVHTSSHRILTELSEEEWEEEIVAPKRKLESLLGVEALAFCFPNGRPLMDFLPKHLVFLRKAGYACAFSTESALFTIGTNDNMAIGRIGVGDDVTSDPDYFRLNVSGVINLIKRTIK